MVGRVGTKYREVVGLVVLSLLSLEAIPSILGRS